MSLYVGNTKIPGLTTLDYMTIINGRSNLSDLDDVFITTPEDGYILKYNSTSHKWEISDDLINLPSNFMTLDTTQQTSAAKAIFGTDYAFGSDSTQKNLLAVISNSNSTSGNWIGKMTVGAKNRTLILGTYGNMCVLGAHSWTNAQAGTGATWDDIYINPDGNKSVFIGGSPINGTQSLMKISNVGSGTTGTVKINRSSNLSNNFKDVACWGDDISHFDNIGYMTIADQDYEFDTQYIRGNNSSTININFSDSTKRGYVFVEYDYYDNYPNLNITCNNYFDNYIYLYNGIYDRLYLSINNITGPNSNSNIRVFYPTSDVFQIPQNTGIKIRITIIDFGSSFASAFSYQYGAIITSEPTYIDTSQYINS